MVVDAIYFCKRCSHNLTFREINRLVPTISVILVLYLIATFIYLINKPKI